MVSNVFMNYALSFATLAWVAFLVLYAIRNWRFVAIVIETLPRDFVGVSRFIRTSIRVLICQLSGKSVGDIFDEVCEKYPSKICFQTNKQQWTFREVLERSNQVANYFLKNGFRKGDTVALFMEGCPEYVCIWLGLSKIGVVTSLVNTNLRFLQLKHSLQTVQCKAVIFENQLSHAIAEILDVELATENRCPSLFLMENHHKSKDANLNSEVSKLIRSQSILLSKELLSSPKTKPQLTRDEKPQFSDQLMHIYTSGTTGLPKGAVVKHSRFIAASITYKILCDLQRTDVLYTCLPLYHSMGGVTAVGQALVNGTTVVIREKFSARSFWKDCIDNNVTVTQSIGEVCRYLLNSPVTAEESMHQVRLLICSGLKPEIWTPFVQRFKIKNVVEFYGATEGNCGAFNFDNTVGAVGFIPVLMRKRISMGLFKVDESTGELVRDPKTGMAIRCEFNETGEFVGKILKSNPLKEFNGYCNNKDATSKKIVKDVFSNGDSAFRTGDYLTMDERGYLYFKDRAGDTFRWKGENVSTLEVETVISTLCGLKDCVVYGVEIPGTNGKAGMATIVDPLGLLELNEFACKVIKSLPSYSRPVFIRLTKQLETTATHKKKKTELQKQSFHIGLTTDPIYFLINGKYVPLSLQLYEQIIGGKLKL